MGKKQPPGEFFTATLVALSIVAPCLRVVHADVIHLTNGNRLQGEVVSEERRHYSVRVPNGILRLPKREVLRIEKESRHSYLIAEGERHLARKDFTGALSYFELALAESEDSTVAREGILTAQERLALHLRSIRLLEEAERAFVKLLDQAPNHPTARAQIASIKREREAADLEVTRCISLVNRGRLEEGYDRLLKVYEDFPEKRPTLEKNLAEAALLLGDRALSKDDFDSAETHYLDAIVYDSDILPRLGRQFSYLTVKQLYPLVGEGRFEEVLEAAEKALTVVPTSDFLNYFRALGLEGTGRPQEAAEVYLALGARKPAGEPVDQLYRLRSDVEAKLQGRDPAAEERAAADVVLPGKWRKASTEHFVVYHRNHQVAKEVAQVAETVYQRLFKQMAPKTHWHKRCDLYLHPNQKTFLDSTGRHAWTGGSHTILHRRGALAEHRIESYQNQPRLAQTVIPHEVGHAMLAHRLQYPPSIPLWVNEGIAVRSEPNFVQRAYHRMVLHAHQVDKLLDVNELVGRTDYPDESAVRLFYAQSFSLVDFLVQQKGLKTFLRFTQELCRKPDSLAHLLKRHYGIAGPTALGNLWRGYLR